MADKRRWKYRAGRRPHTVTVGEREPGGIIYASVWNPDARGGQGAQIRITLGHRDRKRAERYARSQAAKLEEGSQELRSGRITLGRLFSQYRRLVTPKKALSTQTADKQRIECWARYLGANKDPLKIGSGEWDGFMTARRTGAIDARGKPVPEGKRLSVGNRTLEADGRWLHAVLRWASRYRIDGEYLLSENPVRGFMDEEYLPREKNPVNDAVSEERHQAMLERARRITMEIRWGGERTPSESWLPELLVIANGTGRRIGSICALRVEDLNLEPGTHTPFGSIDWRAENDKEGYDWKDIPVDVETRAAILRSLEKRRRLGRMGNGPLFPRGTDSDRPITADIANRWFRLAESLEDEDLDPLEPMPKGRTFHGYRSKFATETKHLTDSERAAVGGWKSEQTIRDVYDKLDRKGMLDVLTERRKLREVGA